MLGTMILFARRIFWKDILRELHKDEMQNKEIFLHDNLCAISSLNTRRFCGVKGSDFVCVLKCVVHVCISIISTQTVRVMERDYQLCYY